MANLYATAEWAEARTAALHRDGDRCTVARLFGGECHPSLHVHHVVPLVDGGAPFDVDNLLTACQAHHPMLEAMRRYLTRRAQPRRCRHNHRYDHARRECEQRLTRAA